MHIEPLAPRRLFAAGVDLSFGTGGAFAFPATFTPGNTTDVYFGSHTVESGDHGSTFVAGSDGNAHYVVKLDAAGRPVRNFGRKGYARIPNEAKVLSYDAADGLLYVGGDRGDDGTPRMNVSRLGPTGTLDAAFGDGGVFDYSMAAPADGYAAARVQKIAPLADGSVVLAVTREVQSTDAGSDFDLALIKLRPGGTRDNGFGTRGVVSVYHGYVGQSFANYFVTNDTSDETAYTGAFTDVRIDRRGATRITYVAARGTADNDPTLGLYRKTLPEKGTFAVESKTVAATGAIRRASTRAWTLVDAATAAPASTFAVRYAAPGDAAAYAVVTEHNESRNTFSQKLYTLKPDRPAYAEPFAPAGIGYASAVARSADGRLVVSGGSERLVRLNADFTVDRTFARNGIAKPAERFGIYGAFDPFIDDHGRVLAFERTAAGNVALDRLD